MLVRSLEILERVTGLLPRGWMAPWWELSPNSTELPLQHGTRCDHRRMHHDFEPHCLRIGWRVADVMRFRAG